MGKLIIIEGIDGSGKTTVAQLVASKLGSKAHFISKKSTETVTNYQKSFMSEVRPILWGRSASEPIHEIDEESWLYLHMLWYHMLQEFVLAPKLQQYDYVIMDGWYHKFLARHIVNEKMNPELGTYLSSQLIQGDKTYLLKVSPEVCFERKGGVKPSECGVHKDANITNLKDSFCQYQNKVYEAYAKLDQDGRKFINIDAEVSIDNVVAELVKELGE